MYSRPFQCSAWKDLAEALLSRLRRSLAVGMTPQSRVTRVNSLDAHNLGTLTSITACDKGGLNRQVVESTCRLLINQYLYSIKNSPGKIIGFQIDLLTVIVKVIPVK
jgi:hypothetical protein